VTIQVVLLKLVSKYSLFVISVSRSGVYSLA